MAIQFNNSVTRNVTPAKTVTRAVTAPVTRNVTQDVVSDPAVLLMAKAFDERIAALERGMTELRELIARQSVAATPKSRAAYMREYRKLHPKS